MPRFTIKSPQVIHETVDAEAVIVNLETGHYYMLKETGERIWAALARGASVRDIVAELGGADDGVDGALEATVSTFLRELLAEGLIVPAPDAAGEPRAAGAPALARPGTPVAAPVLEKFQDMKELILLDPVHEVHEDLGWPHPRTAG